MLTFAEEILLLALDDARGVIKPLPVSALEYALSGAILMELALLNRVDADLKQLYAVEDAAPTGDALLDEALHLIKAESSRHSIAHWLNYLAGRGHDIREKVLKRLVEKGVLKIENRKILWVFAVRRYPALDNREIKEVKTRLRSLIMSDEIPDLRDVVLISLVNACRLFNEIFSAAELERWMPRINNLAKLDLIGQEVARSISEIAQAMALAMPMMV